MFEGLTTFTNRQSSDVLRGGAGGEGGIPGTGGNTVVCCGHPGPNDVAG